MAEWPRRIELYHVIIPMLEISVAYGMYFLDFSGIINGQLTNDNVQSVHYPEFSPAKWKCETLTSRIIAFYQCFYLNCLLVATFHHLSAIIHHCCHYIVLIYLYFVLTYL